MWKTVIVSVIALVLGALAGVGMVQARTATTLAAAEKGQETFLKEIEDLKKTNSKALTENEALKKRNEYLAAQLRLAERDASRAAAEPQPPVPDVAAVLEEESGESEADADEPDRPTAPPDWRDRPREDGEPEPDAATREERRQEFVNQMRSRMEEMTNAELAKYSDPAVQQRITTLNEQINYMMDLRQQMREAQTDEERDAIRETMTETGESIRTLAEEQQDYMLRQVANQYGITNAESQDQFIASLKETQDSPYFRSGRMFGGRGRGGPGWGGGGGPQP